MTTREQLHGIACIFCSAQRSATRTIHRNEQFFNGVLEVVGRFFCALDVLVDDVDHVERTHIFEQRSLHGHQTARNHGHRRRQRYLRLTRYIQDIAQELTDIDALNFGGAIPVQDDIKLRKQMRLIYRSKITRDRKRHERIHESACTTQAHRFDGLFEAQTITRAQTPHQP